MDAISTTSKNQPHLKRVLGLWDLIFYGIVLVQPIAAVTLFGIASKISRGHMVSTLLIAMVGMMLTAVSYGRLASLFPSAGSAYTYVGKGLNVHLGFMAGWAMLLDYLIIPVINTIYAALTLQRYLPSVPFFCWVICFVTFTTFLNLLGIKTVARSNRIMLAVMCAVIGIFIILAIIYIDRQSGFHGLLSFKPFYNSQTFNFGYVMTATSFAALTYIGFDGVTTLAEDVKDPKRNMLLAPVIVCLITGLFSGLQIYLAQLVWPDYNSFPNLETAFFDVSARVGGHFLFDAIAIILFIASLGSAIAGQLGAARLLFAMGRDGVLPKRIFAHLNVKSTTPSYNIIIMGILTLVGSIVLGYEGAAELLNFGAFLAFMGVNIAAFKQSYLLRTNHTKPGVLIRTTMPILGFLVCFFIWANLPIPAKILGGIWSLIGLFYLAIKTRGFKSSTLMIDFTDI